MRYIGIVLILSLSSTYAAPNVEPVVIRTQTEITGGGLTGLYQASVIITGVVGGEGYSIFEATGTVTQCSVKTSFSSSYDWEITTEDGNNFPIMGRRKLVGDVSLSTHPRYLIGKHRITIRNASDGIYKTRCAILR